MRSLSFVALILSLIAGCGTSQQTGLTPTEAVKYDPDAMTEAAFAQLDKNKDGTIDGAEMNACPPLKKLKGGKGVTKDDLKARFESYTAGGRDSVVPVGVRVLNDKKEGYPGATVTLTPEPFMGGGFKPATGVTKDDGFAELRVEGATGYGVPSGFYKLTVSKKDAAGAETLPARLNARSQDVREFVNDGRGGGTPITIDAGSP